MKNVAVFLCVQGAWVLLLGAGMLVIALAKATVGSVDENSLVDGAQFTAAGMILCAPVAWLLWKRRL